MKRVMLLAAIVSASVHAEPLEPVTIFGLPLGGKLQSMPKVCPFSVVGDDKSKLLCWIDSPFVYRPTGARSGSIHMPNQSTLPSWAAYASFSAEISKSGELEVLEVRSSDGRAASEIEQSIKARFDLPTDSSLYGPGLPSATWNRPEITIELLCDKRELCHVKFMSARAKAAYDREMEGRRRQEARRSVSP